MRGVEIRTGDAALTDAYRDAGPADPVLARGIFSKLSDEDVGRTVACLPQLCDTGGTVIWTRHRRPPDLAVDIRRSFAEHGFEELGFEGPPDRLFGIRAYWLVALRLPCAPARAVFMFAER